MAERRAAAVAIAVSVAAAADAVVDGWGGKYKVRGLGEKLANQVLVGGF